MSLITLIISLEFPERLLRKIFQAIEELLWKRNIRFELYKFYQESVVGLPLPPDAEIFRRHSARPGQQSGGGGRANLGRAQDDRNEGPRPGG